MIPLLYDADHDLRVYYPAAGSIGRLSDVISCVITEELNGLYELTITYPVNGICIADLMRPCMIAVARPYADGNELKRELAWFDVYKRTFDGNVVTISAYHISYRLGKIAVAGVPNASWLDGALASIAQNSLPSNTLFTITTDSNSDTSVHSGTFYSTDVKTFREYLFDDNYSCVKVYGVEAVYHGTFINLITQRGADRGAEIRYGKNLTSGNIDKDETESFNAIYPYWKKQDTFVKSDALVYPTPQLTPVKALPIDFTNYFETQPSRADLKSLAAQYLEEFKPWLTRETASITFSPEWYQGNAVKEIIDLGDTVTVFYGDADLAGEKMRVVRVKYDCLLEEFTEYTLGELQKGYAVTSRDGISATKQFMA